MNLSTNTQKNICILLGDSVKNQNFMSLTIWTIYAMNNCKFVSEPTSDK